MADNNGSLRIRGRFTAGSSVGLYERHGDVFNPNMLGKAVKTAKTNEESETTFSSLEPGARYWVASKDSDGNWTHAAVTAKEQPQAKPKSAPLQSAALGGPDPTRQIVSGARNTQNAKPSAEPGQPFNFAGETIGKPTPAGERAEEPQPAARQEDVAKGTPQRSSTLTGQATPKPLDEPQPKPRQQDVPKSQPQRSSTEFGDATPKDKDEVVPSRKQEDSGNLKQRSSTPFGEVVPKADAGPRGTADNPSSKEQAAGVRPNPTAKRKSGTKKAAPSAKTLKKEGKS